MPGWSRHPPRRRLVGQRACGQVEPRRRAGVTEAHAAQRSATARRRTCRRRGATNARGRDCPRCAMPACRRSHGLACPRNRPSHRLRARSRRPRIDRVVATRPHPLHAILIAFSGRLLPAALLADVTYLNSAEMQWSNFAAWLITGALVLGAPALGLEPAGGAAGAGHRAVGRSAAARARLGRGAVQRFQA
ncbi:DUF2231 domain-containing protein [Sphingomonas sp. MMS24-JH45]